MTLRPPFPYFGGKRRAASLIWQAFGHDIPNFVDGFFGSGAVTLARHWPAGARFLGAAGRDPSVYAEEDGSASRRAREWALEHGKDPKLRIALCGYEGEHEMPSSWQCVPWKAAGGYAAAAGNKANAARERIWFSPACLRVDVVRAEQRDLFPEPAHG